MRAFLFMLVSTLLATGSESRAQSAEPVQWQPLDAAFAEARDTDRPLLVYVHAAWCGPCRRLERETFPVVQALLDRFARAELDFDDRESRVGIDGVNRSPFDWARHLGLEAPPGFVFLEPDGTLITRVVGFQDAETLGLPLAYVATGAYRHVSFEDYVNRIRQSIRP